MKKLSLIIAAVLVFTGVSKAAFIPGDNKEASHQVAITISDLALLDIESTGTSNDITLSPSAPDEAGEGMSFDGVSDNSLWLNYSSIVSVGKTRSITATLSGDLPGGTSLSVAAADPAASGKGSKGTGQKSAQVLGSTAVDVVTGIGSCYTGNGNNSGVNLDYTLDMNEENYDELYQGSYNVTVTYTITDLQ